MNIIIFGATGATGHHIVEQALAQNHTVTAFVRDPARLKIQHPRLNYVIGDVMNAESVEAAMANHEAVLCALGVFPESKADAKRKQTNIPVCSEGTRHILSAMSTHQVSRLIVESSTSVGESYHTGCLGAGFIVKCAMRSIMEDKELQELLIKNSSTSWTIVRPVKLKNRPASGKLQTGDNLSWSLFSTVSHADVAHFMVDALSTHHTIGHAITVKN